jgi:pimeloyl-ACP methyl ester carboxylesterase
MLLWPVAMALLAYSGPFGIAVTAEPVSLRTPQGIVAVAADDSSSGPLGMAAPAHEARFEVVPCWFRVASDRRIECGELAVPENWSKPQSRLIHLPVVVFRALGDPKEPIVYLSGGPGDSGEMRTADQIRSWLEMLQSLMWTHQRDLIVIGQRGTNWTDSNLRCPALGELWKQSRFEQSDPSRRSALRHATASCARQLATSYDLGAYNTPQSARDVAALREALGIEAWSIYAVSYGTRFALALMKNHPEGLTSVILDSVHPPGVTDPLGVAPSAFLETLGRVFDACTLDTLCRRIYPDLDGRFDAAIKRLRAAPVPITRPDARVRQTVGPSGFVDLLFSLMFASDTVGFIPEVVRGFAKYADSHLNKWLSELATFEGGTDAIAEGAFMAIRCNDEYGLQDPDSWAREAVSLPLLGEWILEREHAIPCVDWPVVPVPAEDNGRVASAIPTILLVGAFDPATPSSYAEFAAATLKRADLFRFPTSGHGVLGSDWCASLIIEAFLDDPDTPPAAGCLNDARPVDFTPSFRMRALGLMAHHRPAEAERVLEQTLVYQHEQLSPDEPEIALTLSALGQLLHEQGRLGEAASALDRALAITSKAYGPDSLETGESAGRLALVYHDHGKTDAAVSLYRQALKILEREYGENDAQVSFYAAKYRELASAPGESESP